MVFCLVSVMDSHRNLLYEAASERALCSIDSSLASSPSAKPINNLFVLKTKPPPLQQQQSER